MKLKNLLAACSLLPLVAVTAHAQQITGTRRSGPPPYGRLRSRSTSLGEIPMTPPRRCMVAALTGPSFIKLSRALMLGVALSLIAGAMTSTFAADRKPIPVPNAPSEMTYESLRGVQYCEVWLFGGTPETGIRGVYYNTSALNDSAGKMDTCPPTMWAKVDADALKAQYDIIAVFKNGPRGWTMDTLRLPVGPVETFDGLQARWMGQGVFPKGVSLSEGMDFKKGLPSYKPIESHRKSAFTFQKGKPVFVLEDAEGTPWVMQAFSKITDPSLTYDSLKDLGAKLKPAPGWKFRVAVLDRDLTVTTPKGYNWIVQDELGNTYDACKEEACSYKP